MIFELSIILSIICTILSGLLFIFNYKNYRRHHAYIEKFAAVFQIFILVGLILFSINLFFHNLIIFQILVIIESIVFCITVYGFFEIFRISGEIRPEREKKLVGIYLVICLTISLIK
ncbi:MAG TPA: hypothetical protein VMV49_05260 [Candidatus Deferrimicrobium sp.]|nr:hypothetical protein [Candidatus Deferrimicrobium sp.]